MYLFYILKASLDCSVLTMAEVDLSPKYPCPRNTPPPSPPPMNRSRVLAISLVSFLLLDPAIAAEEKAGLTCYYHAEKPAKPEFNLDYEGTAYGFSSVEEQKRFTEERAASLYQRIGGKTAVHAAVDLFYEKVLADERVKHFFDDVNMTAQIRKQKEFLSTALGAPTAWTGKDMRAAHQGLDLRDEDFAAIAENLLATLTELKLDRALIDEIMIIVASTKDAVLNR